MADAPSLRVHNVDLARGLACLSMPFFHAAYGLYSSGLIDTLWTKHLFWKIYQIIGLGTFVYVSGMAFVLSTQRGVRWQRLVYRTLKLAAIAAMISLVTYWLMPNKFVRFGVIHFFAVTVILAPLFHKLKHWTILPGLTIIGISLVTTKAGLYPEPWLYITGLMSERPRSIDYIPLMPWFGVFLLGMGCAHWLRMPAQASIPAGWKKPIIWLGQHSLSFYLLHQAAIFVILHGVALLLK